MVLLQPLRRFDRRQRAILVTTGAIVLLAVASMFLSLTALTAAGADHDCGPAAYALVVGPDRATELVANCRTAAAQRLTTALGLGTLTAVGGVLAALLLPAPDAVPPAEQAPSTLPANRARQERPPRRRHPFVGMER